MINAHAEISDPAHPAYPVITGQKRWMLGLFTRLAGELDAAGAERLGRTLMLLHEGALVSYGLGSCPTRSARPSARRGSCWRTRRRPGGAHP